MKLAEDEGESVRVHTTVQVILNPYEASKCFPQNEACERLRRHSHVHEKIRIIINIIGKNGKAIHPHVVIGFDRPKTAKITIGQRRVTQEF